MSDSTAALPVRIPRARRWSRRPIVLLLRRAWRLWRTRIGVALVLLLLGTALIGPLFAPHDPTAFAGVPNTKPASGALLGTEVHDLSRFIAGQAKVSGALASREGTLKDLITNFNRTSAAFASEEGNLRSTIHLLPGEVAAPPSERKPDGARSGPS